MFMASKVLGKLQLPVFPLFKPVRLRKKNKRGNLFIKSYIFVKKLPLKFQKIHSRQMLTVSFGL